MNKIELRTRIPVNYYEPDDPSFDEYIYCDHCRDYVYDHCSLHGPLLVIPDNKVQRIADYPAYVPQAALTIPSDFLHIARSIIPGAGLGVFASMTLPSGVRFGPFCGQQTRRVSSHYCWMIHDSNMRYKHVIDASDANASNWMRYVNCSRHWQEQNLVAYQYRGKIYYRTIKIIPRFTELMVFYGSEFAMTLNIDLRNYNSDEYCQKIAFNRLDIAPSINKELNFFENFNIEAQDVAMSVEEQEFPTTIDDFVIIDTPESPYKTQETLADQKSNEKIFTNNNDDGKTCYICQKTFTSRYNLRRHNISIHKGIISESNAKHNTQIIEQHSIDSKSDKDLPNTNQIVNNNKTCHICHKTFSRFYNLRQHMYRLHETKKVLLTEATHSKIDKITKTYRCNICHKDFSKHLNRHMRTHLEERYSCTKCPYKTNHTSDYNYHIKSHTQAMIYKCDMCTYICGKRPYIINHIRRNHK